MSFNNSLAFLPLCGCECDGLRLSPCPGFSCYGYGLFLSVFYLFVCLVFYLCLLSRCPCTQVISTSSPVVSELIVWVV